MPDTHPLHTRVLNWLLGQGYPLEMRTAHAFQSSSFSVGQSLYFFDIETGKPRELDVLATIGFTHEELDVRIMCLVECKSSLDKPWILFTSPKSSDADAYSYYSRIATPLGMQLLSELHRRSNVALPELLRLPDRVGYGFTQAFTSGPDAAYSATTSIAKAAIAYARLLNPPNEPPSTSTSILFPVVVINTSLFDYHLDEDGDPKLEELSRGVVDLRIPLPGRTASVLVHVVCEDQLTMLAEQMRQLLAHIQSSQSTVLARLVNRWNAAASNYRPASS